ncbi:MAG: site-specific integrase [Bacteroidales bacterium]
MATVTTYQDDRYIGRKGMAPLQIYFYIDRSKVTIPCGISCSPNDFNPKSGKIKSSDKEYRDKNLMIEQIRARVNDILVRFRLRNKPITKALFMKAYNTPDDFPTFYEFIKFYQKSHPKEIEFTTLNTHNVVIKKLKAYAPQLHFDDINEDFIKKYRTYLLKTKENAESTTNKNLATIKKYVRAAMKAKYIDGNPFEEIRIKRNSKASKPVYLDEHELVSLIELYKEGTLDKMKQSVLQFFLFQCLTSLHITDTRKLKIEQIGSRSFTYFRYKNRNSKPDAIVVPLSKPAKALIRHIAGGRKTGFLFSYICADQNINDNIRSIAAVAEIDKKLSSSSGRHTFATLYYRKTKDVYTLKEIMGHSDIRETLIYTHLDNDDKQIGINSFNNIKL